MARKAQPIKLSDDELRSLTTLLRRGTTSARTQARARVLDLSHRGQHPHRIAEMLGVSSAAVFNIKQRYLQEGFAAALTDKPRSGSPSAAPTAHGGGQEGDWVNASLLAPDRWRLRVRSERNEWRGWIIYGMYKAVGNSMKIKITLVLAMTIIAALVTPHVDGRTPDLSGKWRGVVTTPDGNDLQLTYTFKVTDNQLIGTGESPAGTVTIDDGKVSGDSFSFKVTVDGNDYPHTGKFHGDSCDLDIDFGGAIVHMTLKRVTE